MIMSGNKRTRLSPERRAMRRASAASDSDNSALLYIIYFNSSVDNYCFSWRPVKTKRYPIINQKE